MHTTRGCWCQWGVASKAFGRVKCHHQEWQELPEDEDDTCLLLKRFMHVSDLVQPPLLLIPAPVARTCLLGDVKSASHNDLGERASKDCLDIANVVATQPWDLLKASQYMQNRVARNLSPQHDMVEHLKPQFVFEYRARGQANKYA